MFRQVFVGGRGFHHFSRVVISGLSCQLTHQSLARGDRLTLHTYTYRGDALTLTYTLRDERRRAHTSTLLVGPLHTLISASWEIFF